MAAVSRGIGDPQRSTAEEIRLAGRRRTAGRTVMIERQEKTNEGP
jgi:hypothetical protein